MERRDWRAIVLEELPRLHDVQARVCHSRRPRHIARSADSAVCDPRGAGPAATALARDLSRSSSSRGAACMICCKRPTRLLPLLLQRSR